MNTRNTTTNKVDLKIQNGYTLDLGTLIDESFNTFKKTFLISGVVMILLGIVFLVIYGAIFALVFGFSDITSFLTQLQLNQTSTLGMITTLLVSTIPAGLFAPITAGFINANHLAKNNQEIGINVFFDFYKSKFFKDIFISYVIIGFTTGIINVGLQLLDLNFLSFIFQGIISLFTVFTLPLIIYANENYEKAIIKSMQLFIKQPILIFVALLLAFIGVLLGLIALCIGVIFTAPYMYSMMYAIYNQAIGFEEKSVIDEIGLE